MKTPRDPKISGAAPTTILVGALIEHEGRYLLVQEAKTACRGLWSLPGGHLESNESIPSGAIREVHEETGHVIQLTGLCPLSNYVTRSQSTQLVIPFTATILRTDAAPHPDEVLQTSWFSRSELENMQDQLRFPELTFDLIGYYERHNILPLSALTVIEL